MSSSLNEKLLESDTENNSDNDQYHRSSGEPSIPTTETISNAIPNLDASPIFFHQTRLLAELRRLRIQPLHCILCSILIFFLVLALLLAISTFHQKRIELSSFFVAGVFVLPTIIISFHEILMHLKNWNTPNVQKYVVRMLWMVPLYSLQSWLSLLHTTQSFMLYLEPLRDFYEAYAISSFVYFLVALLGGDEILSDILSTKDPVFGYHPAPISWVIPRWEMGNQFLLRCKFGVLTFVAAKTVTALAAVVLKPLDLYIDEADAFDLRRGYVYVSFALNLTTGWALYCLVKLFQVTRQDLTSPRDWRPVGKFLCIKGVVFFTFWQGFVILMLQQFGILGAIGEWDARHVKKTLQSMLICVEMLGFAIAHRYTFSYTEYMPDMRYRGIGAPVEFARETEDQVPGLIMDKKLSPSIIYNPPNILIPSSPSPSPSSFVTTPLFNETAIGAMRLLRSVVPDKEMEDVRRLGTGHIRKDSSEDGIEL